MTDIKTKNSLIALILTSNSLKTPLFQSICLIVRILAGLLMIHNGLDKLADVPGFANNVVTAIGLPSPVFFTYCAAYTEIVGAILLALGLLTRLSASALFTTMLVAIYFHLKVDGIAIRPLETASLYALLYLFFVVNGSGLFGLDNWLDRWLTIKERR